jgi:hypothetical protein
MKTWEEHLSGYKLILWNETNFDINSVLWVKQAVESEMYAFAVDYIRHYAVYTHGGIYLDTDIEVVKSFDELLDTDLLLGYTSYSENNGIESGCFGAQKGHPYIKKCMEYYEQRPFFDEENRLKIMKTNKFNRLSLMRPILAPDLMGNILNNFFSNAGYNIYSWEYFTARKPLTGEITVTKNTYSIHHFVSTYISEAARKRRDFVFRLARYFGKNSLLAKLIYKLRDIAWNLRKHL